MYDKKGPKGPYCFKMAGVTGFEPVPTVLETAVLPLTPCPYVIERALLI